MDAFVPPPPAEIAARLKKSGLGEAVRAELAAAGKPYGEHIARLEAQKTAARGAGVRDVKSALDHAIGAVSRARDAAAEPVREAIARALIEVLKEDRIPLAVAAPVRRPAARRAQTKKPPVAPAPQPPPGALPGGASV